jgi:protein-disulfide isomerase
MLTWAVTSRTLSNILPDGTPTLGEAKAPVLMIEFSDFTCGYCGRFYRETLPLLKTQYINTGKVRFAYRDYPRDERGWGLVAAHAARCAGEQGRFWEMHDRLFAESERLGAAVLKRALQDLRLKTDVFGACMDSEKHVQAILADRDAGTSLGFHGTPGFFLVRTDGKRVADAIKIPGAASFTVFQQQIEKLLRS